MYRQYRGWSTRTHGSHLQICWLLISQFLPSIVLTNPDNSSRDASSQQTCGGVNCTSAHTLPQTMKCRGAETGMLTLPHRTCSLLLARTPPCTQQRKLVSDTQGAPVLLGAMGCHQNGPSKLTSPCHDGPARGERCPPALGMKSAVPKPAAAF